jgi:hypothetical protein
MKVFSRSGLVVPLVSALSLFAPSAQAEEQHGNPPQGRVQQQPAKPPVQAARPPGGHPPGQVAGRGMPATRVYAGHQYRGRVAWEGGRWRREVYNGRDGWWWDVGGVRYFYPEQMDGPPTYISEDYADDVGYPAPVAGGAYPPPSAGYYAPPPPPPPPDPGASALGGAIVGGVLGGLLTGRASGAAAGAVVGGATGAIAGATAASRPGYYWSQGTCYYRYPSGQYVPADERACY